MGRSDPNFWPKVESPIPSTIDLAARRFLAWCDKEFWSEMPDNKPPGGCLECVVDGEAYEARDMSRPGSIGGFNSRRFRNGDSCSET